MFSNNKAVEQVKNSQHNRELFGYHIKSKHVIFSDVTEKKCLRFSQDPFWDGTTYLQRKGLPFHSNTVGYALR